MHSSGPRTLIRGCKGLEKGPAHGKNLDSGGLGALMGKWQSMEAERVLLKRRQGYYIQVIKEAGFVAHTWIKEVDFADFHRSRPLCRRAVSRRYKHGVVGLCGHVQPLSTTILRPEEGFASLMGLRLHWSLACASPCQTIHIHSGLLASYILT